MDMKSLEIGQGAGAARPAGLRATVFRRLRRDPVAVAAASVLVFLVLAALIGAPLAAHFTGHPPNAQYPYALSIDGQPVGVWQRIYFANGVAHNPHGTLFI